MSNVLTQDNVLFDHCYLKRSTVKVSFHRGIHNVTKFNMAFYL